MTLITEVHWCGVAGMATLSCCPESQGVPQTSGHQLHGQLEQKQGLQ